METNVMKKAWSIARNAAKEINCKVSEIHFGECLRMAWASTRAASEITLVAWSYFAGECVVKIDESGYQILSDTREEKDGYLHTTATTPTVITDALMTQLIKYHKMSGVVGFGATVFKAFFSKLSQKEVAAIRDGQYYA